MKALILNSGTGSRLKGKASCKCLTKLSDNTAILDAQITALERCGINDIYITTGYNAELLEKYIRERYQNSASTGKCTFTFIHNPRFESTNYIYSMFLADEYLQGSDILLLHGDMVFEQNVLQDIIAAEHSIMVVDSTKPLPDKDFKAVIKSGHITAVSVNIFDDAVCAQPVYKLLERDWTIWRGRIADFCKQGITNVYAENAFNEVSDHIKLLPLDITGRMCFEVDTDDDLTAAREAYAQMPDREQIVYTGYGSRNNIESILETAHSKKPFVVHGRSFGTAQEMFGQNVVCFSGYKPNPDIADIEKGKSLFEKSNSDFIISIGGGSAIDTAKYIKSSNLSTKHLAIPTSAGTGSESTRFAVVYKDGNKQTIDKAELLPEYVILDPHFLITLPEYHKKSTLLDALCQAIESLWAKGKTPASESYARAAKQIIFDNANEYLSADLSDEKNIPLAQRILNAANLSGKAINISRTTAAHAMSYKLSTMFGIAHGHAVALCLVPVWEHLLETGSAPDILSEAELDNFKNLLKSMNLSINFSTSANKDALPDILAETVNAERLSNHPVSPAKEDLVKMYRLITN